jgi:hypothetical protein
VSAVKNGSAPLWRTEEQRWVERRTQVLQRRDGLREVIAEAMAWHEIGYTSSGVAKQIDASQGTVRAYFDQVEDQHGLAAVLIKRSDELGIDAPLRAPSATGGVK